MQTSAQRQAKYRAANIVEVRERERLHKLKSKYGVTPEMWQAQYDLQGGRCLGCMKPFGSARADKACVDHDHETKAFRGLLCHSCNRSLGLLNENITTLQNLILYLQYQDSRRGTGAASLPRNTDALSDSHEAVSSQDVSLDSRTSVSSVVAGCCV